MIVEFYPPPAVGGGDSVSVNGTAATDADFDDATPAAPANAINVKWQKDAGAPNNVSAHVPYAAPLTVSGGNLDFDETAALGNNARVAVSKNSGAVVGTRRELNLIEGANVTLTIADDAGGEEVDITIASAKPDLVFGWGPHQLAALQTNFAPLEKLSGTNAKILVRAFDDTTEEYVDGVFMTPSDLNTGGTITIRAVVAPKTGAASKNIGMTFGHRALSSNEAHDQTYTDVDSGAIAVTATTGQVTVISWTVGVSTAGWTANEHVQFRLSRDPGVASDLTGDMYLLNFAINIPRT